MDQQCQSLNPIDNSHHPDPIAKQKAEDFQMLELLARQTKLYTMGESTSVPIETAQELYQSIAFCLDLGREQGEPASEHTHPALEDLFQLGQRRIQHLIARSKGLFALVEKNSPPVANIAYQDTVKEIGVFFRMYDPRFFAQDIPCGIDYQLFLPVPQGHQGIVFIGEYLKRLLTENLFCRRFEPEHTVALLDAFCPDYQGLLINLFQPVFTNALGLALLQKDPLWLNIDNLDRQLILSRLMGLEKEEIRCLLLDAVSFLLHSLHLTDRDGYYAAAALDLLPGLCAARDTGNLDSLLLTLDYRESARRPSNRYIDNPQLEESRLRQLVEEIRSCRYPSDKVAMLRHVQNLQDFTDILDAAFFGEEFFAAFPLLGDPELARLLHLLREQQDHADLPPWGMALQAYIKSLEKDRQIRIAGYLEE